MKVCFCVSSFPALSQTFVTTQVLYAVRCGHDVTVACKAFDPDTPLSSEARELIGRVRIVFWPPQNPALLKALPTALFNRLVARLDRNAWRRQIDADLVIAHFGYRGAAVARAQRGWAGRPPLVTVFHGRDVSVERRKNAMALYRDLFAEGDLHLTVNALFAAQLIDCGAPAARVDTHHLGIPVTRYGFTPPAPGKILRLLSVSRLVEKKGLSVAIEALALMRDSHPDVDWRYDIGGDGPLEAALKAQVARAGLQDRIRFLGALSHEETLRRISEADVLLVPSVTAADGDQEGIPVTLMEAMALGTPVCTTRHSGIPELVTHGETGVLSDEGDAAGLRDNLASLALDKDSAATLAKAARHKVERDFNEDRQNAHLLARCEMLVTKGR
ncbi:glycosyltransferase [Roseobacter weihaiensis]|uniref:glycosyltransferase n=1 Tax=Roseobacter weihaiensis TaxID=2763262 RepID=UPI001D0B17F5|nr:glycosyltransferase [Roseobacter sp. H9]